MGIFSSKQNTQQSSSHTNKPKSSTNYQTNLKEALKAHGLHGGAREVAAIRTRKARTAETRARDKSSIHFGKRK